MEAHLVCDPASGLEDLVKRVRIDADDGVRGFDKVKNLFLSDLNVAYSSILLNDNPVLILLGNAAKDCPV